MKRGTIVIVIMLAIAVTAAAISVVYHYRNQRRALAFWGTATAQLIDRAPAVELLELGEPDRSISLADESLDAPPPEESRDEQPAAQAVEFNEVPWLVAQTKDAAGAQGIANLRRALVLDTTYDWSDDGADDAAEPDWQYAVSLNDGRNWATVLFDFDSRQVGLTGGRKTVLLMPEANEDFRQFFVEQFSTSDDEPQTDPPAETPVGDEQEGKGSGPEGGKD